MTMPSGHEGPTIDSLIHQLQHSGPSVRTHAAAALGLLGPRAVAAVPALAAALGDESAAVRKMAALALGDLGPAAGAAIPALIAALGDPNAGVRRRVAVALGELGASAAVPALKRVAVDDVDDGVGRAAGHAIDEIERSTPHVRAAA